MIAAPKTRNAHLLSSWAAGIALLCLGIGGQGAMSPLLPTPSQKASSPSVDDKVMVEIFEPPSAATEDENTEVTEPEALLPDLEIPPLPEITPPLTPPEMVEITPLEKVPEPPPPIKPKAKSPPPAERPKSSPPARPSASPGSGGTGGSSSAPVAFNPGAGGRFPSPTYPASARAAKIEGTVRILVTVETSGLPSDVEVTASSGSSALDSAARDTIRRRWRWPAGSVRKVIVPVRFVLQ